MLRPGDWISMPKYNADGVVIDVTLNTVKVRNWDNTITTIPPYALVSDSFQNWRGMHESGGRRVKRSINVDMNSVKFCTPEMLAKFRKIALLKDYIEETEEKLKAYNQECGVDDSVLVNGQRQTNLGVFRAYLERYLRSLSAVNQEMHLMVRHLQPTEKGIPMELYFFSISKVWGEYETLQADVMDHGRLDQLLNNFYETRNNPLAQHLKGIGLTMEGIENNPMMFELMTELPCLPRGGFVAVITSK